jgi:hypothetical protein
MRGSMHVWVLNVVATRAWASSFSLNRNETEVEEEQGYTEFWALEHLLLFSARALTSGTNGDYRGVGYIARRSGSHTRRHARALMHP